MFHATFDINLETHYGWVEEDVLTGLRCNILLWLVLQTQLPQGGADEGSPEKLQTYLTKQFYNLEFPPKLGVL